MNTEDIWGFLTSTELRAIDVILITVLSSLIFWLMTGLLSKLGNFIHKKITLVIFSKFKEVNRKYIKQTVSLSEIIEIEKRLREGGELKWYERKSYAKYKELTKKSMRQFVNEFQEKEKLK
ncbi:MAG: hypothetical protein LPK00_03095 [Bacillaceae bacterium]|nr:hypothetical protein [Bacillaceae bacterium]